MTVRNFYHITVILFITIFFALQCEAQSRSSSIKPRWINDPPTPTNGTFKYEIVTAEANNLDAAREKILSQLVTRTGIKTGMVVVTTNKSTNHSNQIWENGKLTERIEYDSHTSSTAESSRAKLYVENISEYWTKDQNGNYFLTCLMAKSELDKVPLFDNIELTRNYGVKGFIRSLVIPGWGQFYKGSTFKGAMILGGTAILAGGIIFCENQRCDYVNKMKRTHDNSLIKSYSSKRDNFETGRNICIGATAALYLYNLIDALASPGAERIIVRNYGRRPGSMYTVIPTISNNGCPQLCAMITF